MNQLQNRGGILQIPLKRLGAHRIPLALWQGQHGSLLNAEQRGHPSKVRPGEASVQAMVKSPGLKKANLVCSELQVQSPQFTLPAY